MANNYANNKTALALSEPNLLVPGKKPIGQVEIDWSHPLARGLTEFYLCDQYNRVVNLADGVVYEASGNNTPIIHTAEGACTSFHTDNAAMVAVSSKPFDEYTVISKFRVNKSVSKWRNVFTRSTGSFSSPYYIFTLGTASTGDLRVTVSDGTTYVDLLAGYTQNTYNALALTVSSSTASAYVDGKLANTSSLDYRTTASNQTVIGRLDTSTGYSHDDLIVYAIRYNRALSPQEIKLLHQNPYAFLKPANQTPYLYSVGTASSGVTVTGIVDTVSLTEQTATVQTTINITGTVDTVGLTEQDATVTQATATDITGTVDAVSLAEQAATVSLGKTITGTVDAVALTEQVASVTAATAVTGSVDTIAIAEQTAVVLQAQTIVGTIDSIAITEQTALISIGTSVTGTVDAITLLEQAANVTASTNITGLVDSLSFTEIDASITTGNTTLTSADLDAIIAAMEAAGFLKLNEYLALK